VTNDFLPTVLDLLNIEHPNPEWPSDGMSLLPLLRGEVPATTPRSKGMGFRLGKQRAWQQDFGTEVPGRGWKTRSRANVLFYPNRTTL